MLAARIIPPTSGSKATLGASLKVNFEHPRLVAEMNQNPAYIRLRNDIIEYLMEIGVTMKQINDQKYILPDLQPTMPGGSIFGRNKRKKNIL